MKVFWKLFMTLWDIGVIVMFISAAVSLEPAIVLRLACVSATFLVLGAIGERYGVIERFRVRDEFLERFR